MAKNSYEKALKALSVEAVDEIEKASKEELEKLIVQAEQAMKQASDELDANEKYQELKSSLKALRSGLSEIRKYQKAKIVIALHTLEASGK